MAPQRANEVTGSPFESEHPLSMILSIHVEKHMKDDAFGVHSHPVAGDDGVSPREMWTLDVTLFSVCFLKLFVETLFFCDFKL